MKTNFFERCLQLADQALQENEVPIGAVLVKDSQIIAEAYNQTEQRNSFICHAEILVIEEACRKLENKYLVNCQLYVSVEPCKMCRAAASLSRIESIHYLLPSAKFGDSGPGYFDTKIQASDEDELIQQSHLLMRSFFEKRR